ncbi:Clr5 domain-containing protein [Pseudomassariella vexata]|uniref:Clr5 domain-domain-containing protein n=1 Tax=Pseudomassariella vexata TaxID=1141098 RepID=A0A1Y2EF83_9PEZI|nr:Clr5 domain-containing protein [Pseudomassariella vexata]ORY70243.1 Clr5 domain-domain-containing protein [Pseudomassariella vexata]
MSMVAVSGDVSAGDAAASSTKKPPPLPPSNLGGNKANGDASGTAGVTTGQRRVRWATTEDWDSYRALITRLYMDEKKPLRELLGIMEHKHNFHATLKMYKYRVAKWGLTKYVKTAQVDEALRQEDQSIQSGHSASRAELPKPRLAARKDRNIVLIDTGSSSLASHHPTPRRIESPDSIKMAEEMVQISRQLVCGCLDSGNWTFDTTKTTMRSNLEQKWLYGMRSARMLFHLGSFTPAFYLYDACFDQYPRLMTSPNPGLFIYAYAATLWLPPVVAQRFLEYAAEMAAIRLPANHPFNLAWSRLKRAGLQQIKAHALHVLQSYWKAIEDQLGTQNLGLLRLAVELSDELTFLGLMDVEKPKKTLRSIAFQQELVNDGNAAQWTKLSLAHTLRHNGRLDEAEAVRHEVGEQWMNSPPEDRCIYVMREYYKLGFQIQEQNRDTQRCVAAGEEYIGFSRENFGPKHAKTFEAMTRVQQTMYRMQGVASPASAVNNAKPMAATAGKMDWSVLLKGDPSDMPYIWMT